jgi:hypothetical protein
MTKYRYNLANRKVSNAGRGKQIEEECIVAVDGWNVWALFGRQITK